MPEDKKKSSKAQKREERLKSFIEDPMASYAFKKKIEQLGISTDEGIKRMTARSRSSSLSSKRKTSPVKKLMNKLKPKK